MHLASAIPTEIKARRAGLPFAKGRKRRLPQTIYLIIPSERLRNCQTEFDVPDYIGKPPALPGNSKSLTAPYFETLRNADKSAATDLFGEGRRAKADEALHRLLPA
jgi:hypothetical protein